MDNYKFTKGKWYADIRSGCCAVYPENRKDDTNGLSPDDDRNIYYSNKGAVYDVDYGYWTMNEESQANALLISKAPEMLEMLKELLYDLEDVSIPTSMYDTVKRAKQLIKEATELN